jgi:acyl carrier protein
MTTDTISTLVQQFTRVFALTKIDPKPLYGIMNHLTSEVGELAESVEVHEGHSQKVLKEPLVGEVVDVIQCALSVLARATEGMSDNDRLYLLTKHFVKKNDKWMSAQAQHMLQQPVSQPATIINAVANTLVGDIPETDTHRKIFNVIADQLGIEARTLQYGQRFIADLGCDSLDTVELIMALEDEFGVEVTSDDEEEAEKIVTLRDACLFTESVIHKHKVKQGIIKPYHPQVAEAVTKTAQTTLAEALGKVGIVPQGGFKGSELTVMAASSSAGKSQFTTEVTAPATGRVYVQIRKHPTGVPQPTGKRRVTRMELKDGLLFVGIGDGKSGWKIDLSKPDPSFLTFRLGLEGGPRGTANQAWEYHKRHNP